MGPVALVLAAAGISAAPELPGRAVPAGTKERFVTLQEAGRPPMRCKILKSWYEPDGGKAYQVQDVETGEMVSIFAPAPRGDFTPKSDKGRAVESRIVHWGTGTHPPAGTPEAPPDATVLGSPAPAVMVAEPVRAEPVRSELVKAEPVKAAPDVRPVVPYAAKNPPPGGWPTAFAKQPPPRFGPTTPAVTAQPSPPATRWPMPVVKTDKQDAKPAAKAAPADKAAVQSAAIAKPAVKTAEAPKQAVQTVLIAKPEAKTPETPKAVKTATAAKPDVKSAEAPKAAGSDWHDSWGKVEQPKSALLASAAPPTAPAPRKADPLQDPETYSKVSVEDRVARKFKEKVVKGSDKQLADASPKPAADSPAPAKPTANVPASAKPATDAPAATKPATVVPAKATKAPEKATSPKSDLAPPPPPVPMPLPLQASAVPPVPAAVAAPSPPTVPVPTPGALPPITPTPAPPAVITTTPALAPPVPQPAEPRRPAPAVSVPAPAPPPVPAASGVPAYISAASQPANDYEGNAFSAPRRAPKSNAGQAQGVPRPVSQMPGYVVVPGAGGSFAASAEPPAMIVTAPPAGVVAVGYPSGAPEPASLNQPTPVNAGTSPWELLAALRTSLYPSQREWAADRLATCDWRSQPAVVEGLVFAARNDPAPMVRVGCLRALARMHAVCDMAVAAARELQNDTDARVRQEAEQTLGALQSVRPVRRID
jgi:hypothetical protein